MALTCIEILCGVQLMETWFEHQQYRQELALTVHMSFSCHRQSVYTCSPASGTTVLTTACTEATAEKLSMKVCLFCTGTEVSTMTISSRFSKRSMKQYAT